MERSSEKWHGTFYLSYRMVSRAGVEPEQTVASRLSCRTCDGSRTRRPDVAQRSVRKL
jgi:hypothetical protein